MNNRLIVLLALSWILTDSSLAQSNIRDGLDGSVGDVVSLQALGREGSFPDGENGVAIQSLVCNIGQVDIPVLAPMNADHPMTAFLIARQDSDRMIQISNRSFVFHHFFSLSQNGCDTCPTPGNGTTIPVMCSDIHSPSIYGAPEWLGHPDEINPWLGEWDPMCSHFDRGIPEQDPPFDCDSQRSPIVDASPVEYRVRVADEYFDQPESLFFAQVQNLFLGEAELLRGDSLGSRRFVPNWTGQAWNLTIPSGGSNDLVAGSVLEQWEGATLRSSRGADDGRFYIAAKITGPNQGLYHYEYAFHNRDFSAAVKRYQIPVCATTSITNVVFRDIDRDASNDWTVSRSSTHVIFETNDSPQRWNTLFNVGFDCDSAPSPDSTLLANAFDSNEVLHIDQWAPTPTLRLSVLPAQVQVGDTLSFDAATGGESEPLLLAIVSVSGQALFRSILIDQFALDGSWSQSAIVPTGLSGIELGFQVLGLGACGNLLVTDRALVVFL